MPKGKTTPELYLALHNGLRPMQLIELGYPKASVYKYSSRYNKTVKPAFEKIIGVRAAEVKKEKSEVIENES